MRYIDLMGGQKPHLLVKTINNLGAETRVQYAPSTKFYLQDKLDGKPWITRCRSRSMSSSGSRPTTTSAATASSPATPTTTAISTASSASSAASAWSSSGTRKSSALSRRRAASSPDAPTRRCLACAAGAHQDLVSHRRLSRTRARLSYFADMLNERDKASTIREPGLKRVAGRERCCSPTRCSRPALTLDEEREACRALKGAMLRQEIYAP